MILTKKNSTWHRTSASKISIDKGAPVGILASRVDSNIPTGWLLCDGSTFDETIYPELYVILGTNILPDLRECVLKGVGTNTRGAVHKTVALGAFQDDSVQAHTHSMPHTHTRGSWNFTGTAGYFTRNNELQEYGALYTQSSVRYTQSPGGTFTAVCGGIGMNAANGWSGSTSEPSNASTGSTGSTTTEVKAIGVNYIIKAR